MIHNQSSNNEGIIEYYQDNDQLKNNFDDRFKSRGNIDSKMNNDSQYLYTKYLINDEKK